MAVKIRVVLLYVILFSMHVFLLPLTCARAAEEVEKGTIYGKVVFDDVAIEGTKVVLEELGSEFYVTKFEIQTDPDGRYVFRNLSLNTGYILTTTIDGYNHSRFFELNDTEKQVNFNFSGRLEVQVKSPTGSEVDGQLLRLYNFMGVNELNTTTDAIGLGVFEHLDIDDTYYIVMNYRKIPYSIMTRLEEKVQRLEIRAFESTTSDEDFLIDFQHLILQSNGEEIDVWEVINMQNEGDKVFNTSWLKGWVPTNSYDLSHDTMDCCFQLFDTGDFMFDPMTPLFPSNKTRLSLNYKMDASKPKQIIEKRIVYDTDRLVILVKKLPNLKIDNLVGLDLLGSEIYGGNEYFKLEGTKLKASNLVQIRLVNEISFLELLPNVDQIWNIVKIIVPIGLISFVFITSNRKDELEA